MGDRFDRPRPRQRGDRVMVRRGKPPPVILAWGLGAPAAIGHNDGPPLDDETPGYLFRRYRWTKAHAKIWKTPTMGVLKFRIARAEAAGLSYRDYMLTLLDTGRFAQAKDRDMARKEALSKIQAAWTALMPRLCPDAPRMNAAIVLSSLTAAYDDDARAYHNLVHVAALLGDFERHAGPRHDIDALCAAALFHDAIYDPKRSDNEEASARLATLHLTDLGAAPDRVSRISTLIMATRHRAEDITAAIGDVDIALLLDCDLAILAAEPDRYAAYAAAVRREYAHVPDADFRRGRARILQGFLDRPQIYVTPVLATAWDKVARRNLIIERDSLLSHETCDGG